MSNDQADYPPGTTPPPDVSGAAESSAHGRKAKFGVATDLWLPLLPYPDTKEKRLYLRVNEEWRYWDHFDPFVWQSVQSAFSKCTDNLEVAVWYHRSVIVGLVVRSKYSTTECDSGA